MKPFSEACEHNKKPILRVLQQYFANGESVLEIGSGTGQHAVYFAKELFPIRWITSDLVQNHPGIRAWLDEANLPNILGPLTLDADQPEWPITEVDAVFSANTMHIMHWQTVKNTFAGVGRVLRSGGEFCLYGPFNYQGAYTSESNARFDQSLRQRDPESAIRHFEELDALARQVDLDLVGDHAMPANNRLLVWRKH
jgi:cyclopropane fatty-acyl-phospholipid synthase-like methyltransferase